MTAKTRHRRSSNHSRLASAQDLRDALSPARAQPTPGAGETAAGTIPLPTQAPPFLHGLPAPGEVYRPQQAVTRALAELIDVHYYTDFFEQAIAAVARQNIPELDQIETLAQFYFYVDALVTWIPEIRVWSWDGDVLHERTVYLRITQFYYYFNQPQLEALQSPIEPEEGAELSPLSYWLREFAVAWGEFLDTPASTRYLETFKYAPEYTWQDYEKAPEDYATFNEFFARCFRDIDALRPVASREDDRVIVFPAESTFVGQWAVSTPVGPPLPAPPSIVVKNIEWSITELLQDSEHAESFAGGIFCHSFLNTYDYHRLHTPVAGRVIEAKIIPGQVYLEVELDNQGDPDEADPSSNVARAVIPKRYLDADDPTGYQFVQCRGLLVLESAIGRVAVLPMGMAQVSSVVFTKPTPRGPEPIVLPAKEREALDYHRRVERINERLGEELVGRELHKGEVFSYFQFGGSDCVVVFEREACVNVTAVANVHYPIRSQYAYSNINTLRRRKT